MRRCAIALSALALILSISACGSSDDDTSSKSTTTTTAAARADDTGAKDLKAACQPYATVQALLASTEDLATRSNTAQKAADDQLHQAVEELDKVIGGTDEVDASLEVLGAVSFQPTDQEGAVQQGDIDTSLAQLDKVLGDTCAATGECPAPETLEAEGLKCDSEGNVTPDDSKAGTTTTTEAASEEGLQTECPAPETLEAEGLVCNDQGQVSPAPTTEQPTECPAPETLEAEGLQCDSEGNVTPKDDGGTVVGKVDECPAPETLEAEGLTCDSEGVLRKAG